MRKPSLIVLLLLCMRIGIAEDASVVEWHPENSLTWADFQGPVPRGIDDERVAATAAMISWSYQYEIATTGKNCRFSIAALDTAALFRRDESWVRPGHATDAILEHEQVHFDIARVYSEKFRNATRELVGSTHDCNGSSERKATRSAQTTIAEIVGSIYDDIWQDFRRTQEAYDRETRHGIDALEQARWTDTIRGTVRNSGKL